MGEANHKLDAHVSGTLLLCQGITLKDLAWAIGTDLGHKVHESTVNASLRRLGKELR